MTIAIGFKDLQKLVSAQQQDKARNELYDRLINKPFWIWDREQHKQADIDTDGDYCFNHIIGLPQKDGQDKPLYDYEQLIYDSLVGKLPLVSIETLVAGLVVIPEVQQSALADKGGVPNSHASDTAKRVRGINL